MWYQFRACCFGLGQALPADFVTRLGVSRLRATSARHLGTSVPRPGFRGILGLGSTVSSRFAVRLLFRGVIDFSPFLTELTLGALREGRALRLGGFMEKAGAVSLASTQS